MNLYIALPAFAFLAALIALSTNFAFRNRIKICERAYHVFSNLADLFEPQAVMLPFLLEATTFEESSRIYGVRTYLELLETPELCMEPGTFGYTGL